MKRQGEEFATAAFIIAPGAPDTVKQMLQSNNRSKFFSGVRAPDASKYELLNYISGGACACTRFPAPAPF